MFAKGQCSHRIANVLRFFLKSLALSYIFSGKKKEKETFLSEPSNSKTQFAHELCPKRVWLWQTVCQEKEDWIFNNWTCYFVNLKAAMLRMTNCFTSDVGKRIHKMYCVWCQKTYPTRVWLAFSVWPTMVPHICFCQHFLDLQWTYRYRELTYITPINLTEGVCTRVIVGSLNL